MKRRAAIVKAAKGATTVRPLIGPFLRYCGEVGFEISEMPSGERGTERWPPISGDWEAVRAESIGEVFVWC